MKNEFFNPDDFPFVVHGFFEELMSPEGDRFYGTRRVEAPDRPLGYFGRRTIVLTEPIRVRVGVNFKIINASVRRPKRVVGTLQAICGRPKTQPN